MRALLALLILVSLCSCASDMTDSSARRRMLTTLDARVSKPFERGVLLKPSAQSEASLGLTLAPLIIRGNSSAENDGSSGQLFVFYKEGTVSVHGRSYAQLSYGWIDELANTTSITPSWHGLRLTLNSAGYPVLWEILGDEQKPRVFFVADSLERAALLLWPRPHAGRRHAVEQAWEAAPNVLVARILDDGPIPMGPIIYADEISGAITTILCRCMPAQIRRVESTAEYLLYPARDFTRILSLESERHPGLERLASFLSQPERNETGLEECLRLPEF